MIRAIYENGVLRPTVPLRMPEGTRVRLMIVNRAGGPAAHDVALARAAVDRIRALPIRGATDGDPVGRNHDRYLYADLSDFAKKPPR